MSRYKFPVRGDCGNYPFVREGEVRAADASGGSLSISEVCVVYGLLLRLWRPDINPVWYPWPKDPYKSSYAYERYWDNIRP